MPSDKIVPDGGASEGIGGGDGTGGRTDNARPAPMSTMRRMSSELAEAAKAMGARLNFVDRIKSLKVVVKSNEFAAYRSKIKNPIEVCRKEMAELKCVSLDRRLVQFEVTGPDDMLMKGKKRAADLEKLYIHKACERQLKTMKHTAIVATVLILLASVVDFVEAKRDDAFNDSEFQFTIICKTGVMFPIGLCWRFGTRTLGTT
jgi:hypothetical protein